MHGVRVPADKAKRENRTIILGFGGNAWNADHMAGYLHELFPEAEVITFHYRGYAPSSGRPSATALVSDAPLVFDCAIGAHAPAKTIVVGFSIGTGVATHLARERKADGAILVICV